MSLLERALAPKLAGAELAARSQEDQRRALVLATLRRIVGDAAKLSSCPPDPAAVEALVSRALPELLRASCQAPAVRAAARALGVAPLERLAVALEGGASRG